MDNSQTDQSALSSEESSLKERLLRVIKGEVVSIRIFPSVAINESLEFNPIVNRFSSIKDGSHHKKRLELEVKKGICVVQAQNRMTELFRSDRNLQDNYALWIRTYDRYYEPNPDSRRIY